MPWESLWISERFVHNPIMRCGYDNVPDATEGTRLAGALRLRSRW
jgi:hypothetical protein